MKNSKTWKDALLGMKPALVALIFSAFLTMSSIYAVDYREIIIGIIAAILVLYKKVAALPLIIICAILGIVLYAI